MSIKESWNKIKGKIALIPADTKHSLFTAFLIVLVGTASFGLGRLSVDGGGSAEGIKILMPQGQSAAIVQGFDREEIEVATENQKLPDSVYVPEQGGEVVASKSGSKYHLPWCAGAKQIAEKNLITFASVEAARAAGYTPAANCKGLK